MPLCNWLTWSSYVKHVQQRVTGCLKSRTALTETIAIVVAVSLLQQHTVIMEAGVLCLSSRRGSSDCRYTPPRMHRFAEPGEKLLLKEALCQIQYAVMRICVRRRNAL